MYAYWSFQLTLINLDLSPHVTVQKFSLRNAHLFSEGHLVDVVLVCRGNQACICHSRMFQLTY